MKPADMVILDLSGNVIDGNLNPSSDTPTHLELYKAFSEIKGICYTHSNYATSYAQAGKPIVAMGTTHADYFYRDVPCSRELTEAETKNDYEKNTGLVIAEIFKNLDYKSIPAVLVKHHGVFTWGKSAMDSVHNAIVLEEVAKMNFKAELINQENNRLEQYTLDKHYNRKHGKDAYYGQKKERGKCMNEDILTKLNYIKNNTDDKNIIKYCSEQIINFKQNISGFIDEYNEQLQKDIFNKRFGTSSKQNYINLPKLTPAEQNIPNDMSQIADNINTLYDEIHKEAIDKTTGFIKKSIKEQELKIGNNFSNEFIDELKNNENKIIRNNYIESLDILVKKNNKN